MDRATKPPVSLESGAARLTRVEQQSEQATAQVAQLQETVDHLLVVIAGLQATVTGLLPIIPLNTQRERSYQIKRLVEIVPQYETVQS